MEHDVPRLLQAILDRLPGKKTQEQLAERLSHGGTQISQPQVSRWLKGQKPDLPNYNLIVSVATEMGVLGDIRSEDVAASLPTRKPAPTMRVIGYVGAGAEAHFYAVSHDDYEEVPRPADASNKAVALEIRGKSWGPLMESWLVYYDDVRSPVTPDLLNRVCIVGLADDRVLIKEIRSDGNGGYNLYPNTTTDEVIYDADIEWAARVVGMKPR